MERRRGRMDFFFFFVVVILGCCGRSFGGRGEGFMKTSMNFGLCGNEGLPGQKMMALSR